MIVPGRVLVIDDAFDDVRDVIAELREKGESVVFTTSLPEDEMLENVRLLIIDLFLAGEDPDSNFDAVASILEKVSERTEFFLIAIWSSHARNKDDDQRIVETLKSCFKTRTGGKEIRAIFLEPFGKAIPQSELCDRIAKSLELHPECGLLLETERVVEKARDQAVSDIIATASIPVILKALKEEVGETALSRQMIDLFLRILGRHSKATDTMSTCIGKVSTSSEVVDSEKYGLIHNLQSYHSVASDERTWTGDILRRTAREGEYEYAVVVSPACDFAQCKQRPFEYMRIIQAVRINHEDLVKEEAKEQLRAKLRVKQDTLEACIRAVFEDGKFLQKRFYVLNFLKDDDLGGLFHLVLDFHQVSKTPFRETGTLIEQNDGWKRICRVDTPLIESLLHEYSAYASRIGVQATPEDIVESIVEKSKRQAPQPSS